MTIFYHIIFIFYYIFVFTIFQNWEHIFYIFVSFKENFYCWIFFFRMYSCLLRRIKIIYRYRLRINRLQHGFWFFLNVYFPLIFIWKSAYFKKNNNNTKDFNELFTIFFLSLSFNLYYTQLSFFFLAVLAFLWTNAF